MNSLIFLLRDAEIYRGNDFSYFFYWRENTLSVFINLVNSNANWVMFYIFSFSFIVSICKFQL